MYVMNKQSHILFRSFIKKNIFLCLLVFSQITFGADLSIDAGRFCKTRLPVEVGEKVEISLSGPSARKLFLTLEDVEEKVKVNNYVMRRSESIVCSRYDDQYYCSFEMTSSGSFKTPKQCQQQQLQTSHGAYPQ